MPFGALRMIHSLYGGHGPQKGLVGICLGAICENSQFVSFLKPALGDVSIQSSSSVLAALSSCCVVVASRIACSLLPSSSYISFFDEVHDLAVQSLRN